MKDDHCQNYCNTAHLLLIDGTVQILDLTCGETEDLLLQTDELPVLAFCQFLLSFFASDLRPASSLQVVHRSLRVARQPHRLR
jgi:hypothetical protein